MLKYKIDSTSINYNRTGDYTYMINLVMKDYSTYFNASEYLQKRYDFCMQAIYSCLGRVNNLTNRKLAYMELANFLADIKKISGLNMQIVNKEKLYVKEKPKVKVKRYRLH